MNIRAKAGTCVDLQFVVGAVEFDRQCTSFKSWTMMFNKIAIAGYKR